MRYFHSYKIHIKILEMSDLENGIAGKEEGKNIMRQISEVQGVRGHSTTNIKNSQQCLNNMASEEKAIVNYGMHNWTRC